MAIFEQFPAASWKVGQKPQLFFPVESIQEEGGNRIVERERPYRDGAKLDDTGSKARRWSVEVLFDNSIDETTTANGGALLYPEILNEFIRSFDEHEVGDLVLPTVGKIRARAQSYSRKEVQDAERDAGRLTLKFIEDNEDSVGARSFEPPTVKASARILAEQATFSAQADGVWDGTMADLNEFGDNLEAIASFPTDTVQDIDAQAGIVVAATNRVLHAFTNERPTEKARKQLTDPDSSVTQRKLLTLKDTSAKAKQDLTVEGITRIVVQDTCDLFAIAVSLGTTVEELIRMNPGIDPFNVNKGVTILVPN